MSTSKKLAVGFGALLTLWLVALLITTSWHRDLRSHLHRIAVVDEPMGVAAYEMQLSLVGISRAVLQYQEKGQHTNRDRVATDAESFRKRMAAYEQLASAPQGEEIVRRIDGLFVSFHRLARELMDHRDQQQEMFATLARDSEKLSELLTQIAASLDRKEPDGPKKAAAIDKLRAVIFAASVWLGHYRRTDVARFKENLSEQMGLVQPLLAHFRKLALTDKEQELAAALDSQFGEHLAHVGAFLALHETARQKLSDFLTQSARIERILASDIQSHARQDLIAANTEAHERIDSILTTLWLMLGAGLLVGLITAGSVGRWIGLAERRLRDEGNRFRTLANGAPVMIRLSDTNRLCTWFNKPWLDFTGRTLEQELSEGWCQGVHPDDYDQCQETYRDAYFARRPFTMEYRLRRHDGTFRWVIDSGTPLYGSSGEFEGYVGSCIDIDERKQAEQVVRQSEERFRFLAESMSQKIFTAQPGGALDYVNAQWPEFTGKPCDVLQGNGWLQLIHQDDVEETKRRWEHALATGEPFQVEHRIRRADGEYRWHISRAHALRDPLGSTLLWIGSMSDIDDQKRALQALEAADRRKDEFLAVLSHELRNPLAPIRHALHILRPVPSLEPEHAEAHEVLERQFLQLAGIVEDLLDVFRISHGKIKLHKVTIDLAMVVRLACEDHRSGIERSLRLALEVPEEPIWIQADRTRITQVMSNLLTNAVKYTNPGGHVRVRVTADTARRQAIVSVRDTGIGISPEQLEHVFETFAQADRSLDRSRGGLGLGLSLVKGLIDLHGGDVEAASAGLGRGTEITFSVPLAAAPSPVAEPPDPLPSVARPLRILIVEDNKDTARTLRVLLMRSGHTVSVAHTGTEGVAAALEIRPEVVLCDLGLPEMDGYEVARSLRGHSATAWARLIAVSGYGQEEDRQRSEAAGFDLHLTKPVDPAELQRLLAVIKIGP